MWLFGLLFTVIDNPQRFCADYLNIKLKLFQKILIYAMMSNNYFLFCASRGLGKTWLTALFCVVRCILFPGTKIVVASGTKSQATEVIGKINDDFMKLHGWGSDNLRNEISFISTSVNNAKVEFRNGSWIKVVTSSDNARSARANIIIVDEFRMVDLDVINTVLRKFLSAPRSPEYLNKPEYAHLSERNKEIYMSSCWLASDWSYSKVQAYAVNFLDDTKKYFVCGLPYQIAIKEGLLSREQVQDEMSEADFDALKFSMEMECLWYSDAEGAFFSYDDVSKRRKNKAPMYPVNFPTYQKYDKLKIPPKLPNEIRVMSVDIALMASKKKINNDASSIIINSAIPNNDNVFISNIVYLQNYEGLNTDELGQIIRRYYSEYDIDYIALDCGGVGLGVYDYLIKPQYDTDTGELYRPISCCNNQEMADRCKDKSAKKVIWSIKASESFNSEMYLLLRSGFQKAKINLLISEFEAEEFLRDNIKGYAKMSANEQMLFKLPYIQTSLLVSELIKMEHKVNDSSSKVKLKEKSGERKDRVSSLGYNFYVTTQLEMQLLNKQKQDFNVNNFASLVRKPKIYGNSR